MKGFRFLLTTLWTVLAFGLFAPVGLAQDNRTPAATVTPGGMPSA